uniref:Uncharacterized protein n=1 Tax=Chenopodium quinoa TaxID=63459 RepID=A0A803KVL2_CHEQI
MAGAAVAGVAMLAWGMYKLVSGESSSDKDEHKNKAKAPQPREFIRTLDYASNKMMKAPGTAGKFVMKRVVFESNPKFYFMNLRAGKCSDVRTNGLVLIESDVLHGSAG